MIKSWLENLTNSSTNNSTHQNIKYQIYDSNYKGGKPEVTSHVFQGPDSNSTTSPKMSAHIFENSGITACVQMDDIDENRFYIFGDRFSEQDIENCYERQKEIYKKGL